MKNIFKTPADFNRQTGNSYLEAFSTKYINYEKLLLLFIFFIVLCG